eukprot:TRINITY_DN21753_c0_g1_i1.p1 TRINITY_DN21753_c0_g1~~TRINITY_DN21753_c0_g1_i1.p1  ORF type:complete len:365 (+),score=23.77 TRINITY_DN21753_c0_g1_i1:253-1347(+)
MPPMMFMESSAFLNLNGYQTGVVLASHGKFSDNQLPSIRCSPVLIRHADHLQAYIRETERKFSVSKSVNLPFCQASSAKKNFSYVMEITYCRNLPPLPCRNKSAVCFCRHRQALRSSNVFPISPSSHRFTWRCRHSSQSSNAALAPSTEVEQDCRAHELKGDDTCLEQGIEGLSVVRLRPQELTADKFAPYGQVVGPTEDGTVFGPNDAALDISRGIPRVYVMRLHDKPALFDTVTHHASVTQCLGAIGAASGPWYLAVAPPSLVEDAASTSGSDPNLSDSCEIVSSPAGHHYRAPRVEDVVAFRIEGPQVVKLHVGTWHAGPFFAEPSMDFCNLELADTNVVDHTSHVFSTSHAIRFEIDTVS